MKLKITGNKWFNSEPLTPRDISGHVVLVNFWTFSCVNCIRSFPRIREIWNKYKDKKFIVISIHSPQFEFEKNPDCVKRAAIANNIYWPIVIDNQSINWKRFKTKFWPTNYLVNKNGEIVYCHMGGGEFTKLEKIIEDLIHERKTKVRFSEMFMERTNNVCFSATPDINCGYTKGIIANNTGYLSNKDALYKKPKIIPQNKIALSGEFFSTSEYIQPQKIGSSIFLKFIATEVSLTMEPFGREALAEVRLEGNLFPNEIRGSDVDDSGIVRINEYKTYNILKANFPASGILNISLKEGKFKAYNFTFSGCVNKCDMPSDRPASMDCAV